MPRKARSKKGTAAKAEAAKAEAASFLEKEGTAPPLPGEEGMPAVAQEEEELLLEQKGVVFSVRIDLQEGFMDDTVAIRIGDQEIYRGENVSTDFILGSAGSVEARVPEGPVTVEILVPTRKLSDAIKLDVPPTAYLGVALREQQLQFRVSDQTFMYF